MAGTVTLTAVMDWQNGEPFEGVLEVRLNAASKTDETLVGPAVWQETPFTDGSASVELYPSSALESGAFYTARVYSSRIAGGYKSKKKILETAFAMPDSDAYLHDLAGIEPMVPAAEETVELIAQRAEAAAASIVPLSSQDVADIFGDNA